MYNLNDRIVSTMKHHHHKAHPCVLFAIKDTECIVHVKEECLFAIADDISVLSDIAKGHRGIVDS